VFQPRLWDLGPGYFIDVCGVSPYALTTYTPKSNCVGSLSCRKERTICDWDRREKVFPANCKGDTKPVIGFSEIGMVYDNWYDRGSVYAPANEVGIQKGHYVNREGR
jgi:hypothetical protein